MLLHDHSHRPSWIPGQSNVLAYLKSTAQMMLHHMHLQTECVHTPECGEVNGNDNPTPERVVGSSVLSQFEVIRHAMLEPLSNPWRGFEQCIKAHFDANKYSVLRSLFDAIASQQACNASDSDANDERAKWIADFNFAVASNLILALKRVAEAKCDVDGDGGATDKPTMVLQRILHMSQPEPPSAAPVTVAEVSKSLHAAPTAQLSEAEEKEVSACFKAAILSKRMLMFHSLYLRLVTQGIARHSTPCAGHESLLERTAHGYDYWACRLPEGVLAGLRQGLDRIVQVSSFAGYYAMLGLPIPTPRAQYMRLVNGVRQSLRQG